MNDTQRNPYDLVARQFHAERVPAGEQKYLPMFVSGLPEHGSVLDLGCGSGRPILEHLARLGFAVTGVDRSQRMLEIARTLVPTAKFIHGEMESVELGETFDGVVVWDSLFHVERRLHPAIIARIGQWTKPGGMMLLSTGGSGDEGFTSEMLGHLFIYSGFEPSEVVALLEKAGFRTLVAEVDDPSSRGHFVIVARKEHEP